MYSWSVDTWGGTWPTSGWRTNQVNILFGIQNVPVKGEYKLIIRLADFAKKFLPLIKVTVNNYDKLFNSGSPHLPQVNMPIASQWDINVHMMHLLKERYCK